MAQKNLELNVTILVVSQKGDRRWERLVSYLKSKGAAIQWVETARETYDVLKKHHVNIMIVDYDLPDVRGLKLLRRAKGLRPHVELIFLSEKITVSRAIEAMREGAYDFYEFPINSRLIIAVIEKAIEKQALFVEKTELERRVRERFDFGKVVGRSKAMQHVMEVVASVSPKNVNILLTGETGSGKEMIANAIHYNSRRAAKPFIKVNCAAFSEGVLESELFGHERGAFTGAITKRVGRFELADGGTIFLDEIGDISLSTQIKLLRVIQEKEFERVGGNETIKVDVRIIAATHQDLKKLIEEKRFREDLYYRLNVVYIELPSLRQRKDDIPLLVSFFINKFNEEKDYQIKGITNEAMQILLNYQWPGNVREMENAIESAMALAEKNIIEAKYLPSFLLLTQPRDSNFYQIPQDYTLREIENEIIRQALEKKGGNQTKAAKMLGIGRRTLQRKLKEM
ncbi:MAG: sigma-54 dependent transcriptional regulator [Nitrospirota bacterium]